MKQAKVYPETEISSDHNPLIIKMKIQLKKLSKITKKQHLDTNLLNKSSEAVRYNSEIRSKFNALLTEKLKWKAI